eukprot:g1825.t1
MSSSDNKEEVVNEKKDIDEIVPQLIHKLQVFRKALVSERAHSAELQSRLSQVESLLKEKEARAVSLAKDNASLQEHIVLLTSLQEERDSEAKTPPTRIGFLANLGISPSKRRAKLMDSPGVRKLQDDLQIAKTKLREALTNETELQNEIQRKQELHDANLEIARKNLTSLEADHARTNAKLAQAESKLADRETEIRDAMDAFATLEKKYRKANTEAEQTIAELQAEISALQDMNHQAKVASQRKHEESQKSVEEAQNEAEDLKVRLEIAEKELDQIRERAVIIEQYKDDAVSVSSTGTAASSTNSLNLHVNVGKDTNNPNKLPGESTGGGGVTRLHLGNDSIGPLLTAAVNNATLTSSSTLNALSTQTSSAGDQLSGNLSGMNLSPDGSPASSPASSPTRQIYSDTSVGSAAGVVTVSHNGGEGNRKGEGDVHAPSWHQRQHQQASLASTSGRLLSYRSLLKTLRSDINMFDYLISRFYVLKVRQLLGSWECCLCVQHCVRRDPYDVSAQPSNSASSSNSSVGSKESGGSSVGVRGNRRQFKGGLNGNGVTDSDTPHIGSMFNNDVSTTHGGSSVGGLHLNTNNGATTNGADFANASNMEDVNAILGVDNTMASSSGMSRRTISGGISNNMKGNNGGGGGGGSLGLTQAQQSLLDEFAIETQYNGKRVRHPLRSCVDIIELNEGDVSSTGIRGSPQRFAILYSDGAEMEVFECYRGVRRDYLIYKLRRTVQSCFQGAVAGAKVSSNRSQRRSKSYHSNQSGSTYGSSGHRMSRREILKRGGGEKLLPIGAGGGRRNNRTSYGHGIARKRRSGTEKTT